MASETLTVAAEAAAPPGPLAEFWGYFSANRGAVAGLVIVVTVLLVAAFADVLAPYPPDLTNNAVFLKPPAWQAGGSWAYPLGTDAIGRDILSRLIHGARLSLLIGIAVVALSIVCGIALGLVAGYFRGVTEIAIMRLMDIVLTLPSLLLAIVIVAILGPGLMNAMLAVAVVVLPHYVRITRAAVIELCRANDIPCEERDLSLTEAYRAEEVFCSGTMGELASVTRVDGRVVGDGRPGPLTGRLVGLFRELTAREGTQVVAHEP